MCLAQRHNRGPLSPFSDPAIAPQPQGPPVTKARDALRARGIPNCSPVAPHTQPTERETQTLNKYLSATQSETRQPPLADAHLTAFRSTQPRQPTHPQPNPPPDITHKHDPH